MFTTGGRFHPISISLLFGHKQMKKNLFLTLAFMSSMSVAATYETSADAYTSPYGEWRGQTQYQAFVGTVSDPTAHTITNLTIRIDPQGKVTGISTENNCRLLGLARPGVATHIVTLDVTVTGCHYAGLNRTYQGYLSAFSREKHAAFSLQAIEIGYKQKGGTFNIGSTMKR